MATNPNSSSAAKLEIVIFPWLAMGHLIPFLHLSKLLAQNGHKIHFVSTPRNLSRLPKLPLRLSSQITFVPFPLPPVPNLPPEAESSMDVPYNHQQLLKKAFDSLRPPLTNFLRELKPDWIIYDYASHWLPSAAGGIGCAFFSLFTAATLCFVGPPGRLVGGDSRRSAEDFTAVPDWIPIEMKSNIAYRLHEVSKYVEKTDEDTSGPSDQIRFAVAMEESDALLVRSSPEFEPEWFELLGQMYKGKTIIPVGFLPPPIEEKDEDQSDAVWGEIRDWLDKQQGNSVVYVALGTEAALTRDEIAELASGLEKSGLPFFWALRDHSGSGRMMVAVLLDHHADPNVRTVDGVTPLDILRKLTSDFLFKGAVPGLIHIEPNKLRLCLELVQSAAMVISREEGNVNPQSSTAIYPPMSDEQHNSSSSSSNLNLDSRLVYLNLGATNTGSNQMGSRMESTGDDDSSQREAMNRHDPSMYQYSQDF